MHHRQLLLACGGYFLLGGNLFMNLYHLRYFVTLARMEHYTRAADLLAITQPSLSHAISSLESELGVKLFKKNGRNVTLTKYGKSFLTDAEDILQKLDTSVGNLQLAGKGEGRIDIAFLRTLGSDFVPRILRRFLDENQKRIEEAPEQQQPEPCVHLVGNIPPDKLEETLSRFRSSHAHVEIVIYDSEQISFPNNESDWAQ